MNFMIFIMFINLFIFIGFFTLIRFIQQEKHFEICIY